MNSEYNNLEIEWVDSKTMATYFNISKAKVVANFYNSFNTKTGVVIRDAGFDKKGNLRYRLQVIQNAEGAYTGNIKYIKVNVED